MKKFSRRYKNLKSKVQGTVYSPLEALKLLPKIASANFIETVEVHISLGLDPKYSDQQLRSSVVLPKGTGKSIIVAVIADGLQGQNAISAGADIVGYQDLINEIANGKVNFDKLIVPPSVMSSITKLGRILGPKGLMPSPKAGTVTDNLSLAISEFKAGRLEYRVDRTGIVHLPIGKVNFSVQDLLINLSTIKNSIEKKSSYRSPR
uniref:Ribosomal protein n=1 Tax=Neogoniolithon spectabile TaxID=231755 RepID=A0A3G3MGR0_9FLOR|nr:ribosomal protein L1 [Neogoniolithon spectabile]AYR05991.1 ribosomal protein L1 [Neogoniolithon spectabile]